VKKTATLIMTLAVLLALVACGETNEDKIASMTTNELTNNDGTTALVKNGTETYYFHVGKNETYEITMSFKNESGSVSAFIAKDGVKDNAIYTGTDIPSSTFTVTASEPGEYQIHYEVSNYIGEYTYSAAAK
jgi:ABC-type glycerol-3-phosphate transport system substrate-binding protein